MSNLDKPSINESSRMPREKKIKITIVVVLCLVIFVLCVIAMRTINDSPVEMPVELETVPDVKVEYDEWYVAQSSWKDGAWCIVDKEAVTSINIVESYAGQYATVWDIDEMLFYFTDDGAIYITVGPGVHMIGSMSAAFANFPNALTITGLDKLETSAVTDMSYIFSESGFESIDISNWDTSGVTNFAYMLYKTTNTKEVNMSNLDLSQVVDISYMFANSEAIENIYIENVDTSHILIMTGMFKNMGSSSHVNPTKIHGTLRTDSCTDMSSMFEYSSISNVIDIVKDFNTSNVTNMEKMFFHSLDLYELDLSQWDVSKVKNMNYMFTESICLIRLNMEGWNPINLETADYMFQYCYNLRKFDQWISAPKIKSAQHMFENCYELTSLDVTCFDGAKIKDAKRMFYCVQYVEHIYSNGFTVENFNDDMFEYCVSLKGPTEYDMDKITSEMATTTGYLTPTK